MRALTVALIALGVLAPVAAAAPVAVVPLVDSDGMGAGPVLGPNGTVFYATSAREDGALELMSATPGHAPAQIARLAIHNTNVQGLESDLMDAVGLAASPTRVALAGKEDTTNLDDGGDTLYSEALAGPPQGPLSVTAGDVRTDRVFALDLSGDQLLTAEAATAKAPAALVIRDSAHPGPPRTVVPPPAAGDENDGLIAIAGPWIAYEMPGPASAVAIASASSGQVVATIPLPGIAQRLDLADDGTLAVIVQPAPTQPGKDDLVTTSVADPTLHPLATGVSSAVLRIAAGHVLFARATSPGQQLVLADLATEQTQVVATDSKYFTAADDDGARIAYATGDCVWADAIEAGPVPSPAAHTCGDLVAVDSRLYAPGKHSVGGNVSCETAPGPTCATTAQLATVKSAGHRAVVLGTRRLTVARGTRKDLRFALPTTRLARIRRVVGPRRRSVLLRLRASYSDPAGRHTTEDEGRLRLR